MTLNHKQTCLSPPHRTVSLKPQALGQSTCPEGASKLESMQAREGDGVQCSTHIEPVSACISYDNVLQEQPRNALIQHAEQPHSCAPPLGVHTPRLLQSQPQSMPSCRMPVSMHPPMHGFCNDLSRPEPQQGRTMSDSTVIPEGVPRLAVLAWTLVFTPGPPAVTLWTALVEASHLRTAGARYVPRVC